MSSGDVINFMQTYQRITQQMFKDAYKKFIYNNEFK